MTVEQIQGHSTPLKKRNSNIWERESHDHYVEPSWVWDAFFRTKHFSDGMSVHDPACGFGTCVEAAKRAGMVASGSDIYPRWQHGPYSDELAGRYTLHNFLKDSPFSFVGRVDAICSNPPFKHSEEFASEALTRGFNLVALLLPSNWVTGKRRSEWLRQTPLHKIWFLCPRPSMPPGHVIMSGDKPGNGTTDFAIYVWLRGFDGPPTIDWLYRDRQTQGD